MHSKDLARGGTWVRQRRRGLAQILGVLDAELGPRVSLVALINATHRLVVITRSLAPTISLTCSDNEHSPPRKERHELSD